MGKINLLSKDVSELIAAGEVIERPASIVKELLENSIDANASSITVEIVNGGVSLIRITDDGTGMEKSDMEIAFKRHATSKIKSADDLLSIASLGFRGEALASIAAVSRVEMVSKTFEAQLGNRLLLEGGEQLSIEETGCPNGTTIIVKDLFYNVPARLKFLKKDTSEANAIRGIADKIAISHPEISFKLVSDGKMKLFTSGNSDLKTAIYSVYGKEFSEQLIKVDYVGNGIEVKGFVTKPSASRSNRSMQHFFVNDRYVKSKTCIAAIEEGYKNSIMVGKYPGCVLKVAVPLDSVDVNVHPAKTEVRFINERIVFDAVYFAVKNAILSDDVIKPVAEAFEKKQEKAEEPEQFKMTPKRSADTEAFTAMSADEFRYKVDKAMPQKMSAPQVSYKTESRAKKQIERKPLSDSFSYITDDSLKKAENTVVLRLENGESEIFSEGKRVELPENNKPLEKVDDFDNFKPIGELFSTYLLFEMGDVFYLMDKHAAHERILFEELKKTISSQDRQIMLEPPVVSLSAQELGAVNENREKLEQLGFFAEEFGVHTVIIREAPSVISSELCVEAFMEIVEKLCDNRRDASSDIFENLLHSIACRSAIKANDKTDIAELSELLRLICNNNEIRYCPHGRPIVVTFTKREIEKKFGRV